MSDLMPRYDQVLAAAQQLSADERRRLIAALTHGLDAQAAGSGRSDAPGAALWPGFMLIKDGADSQTPRIVANGIDDQTGQHLLQLDLAGARRVALATSTLPDEQEHQQFHTARTRESADKLGMVHGYSYQDLSQAGWAVVVAAEEDTRLLDALAPLIRHRCEQQRIDPPELRFEAGERCGAWFRRVLGPRGQGFPLRPMRDGPKLPVLIYDPHHPQPRQSGPPSPPGNCRSWLARYGVSIGPVDPSNGVPFYLLVAGRPGPLAPDDSAYIPFGFQYDLDLFWGVGRLCFTAESGQHDYQSYRHYAEQVVDFEQRRARGEPPPYGRRMLYLATRHERDPSTEESEAGLVVPLAGLDSAQPSAGVAGAYGFERSVLRREQATKEALGRALSAGLEGGPPALLFSASHGLGCRPENPRLPQRQGALICHGWQPGTPAADEVLFSADSFDELGQRASVTGMVAVLFACYSVGCPQTDTFSYLSGAPPVIAPRALVARLPQRMLARGALAVLGHVDKAWSYGFAQPEEGLTSQPQAFSDLLRRLLDGQRLGYVTDQFNGIQGAHAAAILDLLNKARSFPNPDYGLDRIAQLWKAYYDMRSYLLLGDPAVRLPFASAPQAQTPGV